MKQNTADKFFLTPPTFTAEELATERAALSPGFFWYELASLIRCKAMEARDMLQLAEWNLEETTSWAVAAHNRAVAGAPLGTDADVLREFMEWSLERAKACHMLRQLDFWEKFVVIGVSPSDMDRNVEGLWFLIGHYCDDSCAESLWDRSGLDAATMVAYFHTDG